MTHPQLVKLAVQWLRSYGCGVILSEQSCVSGEAPDAIGWKARCHSVVVECKVSRADFLADRHKPWRKKPDNAMGCERYFLSAPGLIKREELPSGWGLLVCPGRKVIMEAAASNRRLRSAEGMKYEMNLLLASLRRVEIRIEPQSITEFLKWKNRLLEYNGGIWPQELGPAEDEPNPHLNS